MIRLTVLYNLQPDIDEEHFLEWRLTEHQQSNSSAEGVVRTDFSRNTLAWPPDTVPRYRFMTTAEWPDMKSFEEAFYEPIFQAKLKKNLKMLRDPVFLIGDVLANSEPGS